MGEITIELETQIEHPELLEIAKHVKGELFQEARKVFMWYYVPNQTNNFAPWASTNFENDTFDVQIKDIELQ
jgi:hypothetical protein